MKAVFLDRDGVINVDKGYIYKIDDFEFKEDIFELLKFLQKKGFSLFIITNQSGIGRGYYTLKDFERLNNYMIEELKKKNINIKEVAFCPHHPNDNCECRKPKPGMILKLIEKYKIDIETSILIGDKMSDIQAGQNAGIKRNYLVKDSLKEIIDKLKKDLKDKK